MKLIFFIFFLVTIQAYSKSYKKSIISLEYATSKASKTFQDSSITSNNGIIEYGIKIGAVENRKRLFLSYHYLRKRDQTAYTKGYSVSVVYEGLGSRGSSGLFAGFIAGYENYKFRSSDTITRKHNNFFYGLDFGLNLIITNFLSFDIGTRYQLPFNSKKDEYKVGNTLSTFFAINYQY